VGVVEAIRQVGAAGELPIDVVSFPDVLEAQDSIGESVSRNYTDRVRVGGCKLTIDGSPQGFTALRDRPYYAPVGDYPPGYAGYAAITMEQVQQAVDWSTENGIQIIVHANGEGASDMLIAALGAAKEKYPDGTNRPMLPQPGGVSARRRCLRAEFPSRVLKMQAWPEKSRRSNRIGYRVAHCCACDLDVSS
jgi:predicted amidohydrolase YtcJ